MEVEEAVKARARPPPPPYQPGPRPLPHPPSLSLLSVEMFRYSPGLNSFLKTSILKLFVEIFPDPNSVPRTRRVPTILPCPPRASPTPDPTSWLTRPLLRRQVLTTNIQSQRWNLIHPHPRRLRQ